MALPSIPYLSPIACSLIGWIGQERFVDWLLEGTAGLVKSTPVRLMNTLATWVAQTRKMAHSSFKCVLDPCSYLSARACF